MFDNFINEMFLIYCFTELSGMDHDKYNIELTKVIHKMHARHRRTSK